MQANAQPDLKQAAPDDEVSAMRAQPPQPKPRRARRAFLVLGAVVATGLLAVGSYAWLTRFTESTDDARVEADVVAISARLSGRIAKVLVSSDEHVKAHQVLALIEDQDFKVKLDQASAELASAEASVASAEAEERIASATASGGLQSAKAGVGRSRGDLGGARARIQMAEAELKRAEADAKQSSLDLERDRKLFQSGAISEQEWEGARLADAAAQAGLARAQSALTVARQDKRALESQLAAAQGQLEQSVPVDARIAAAHAATQLAKAHEREAKAAVELAQLQLRYTKIEAPSDGIASAVNILVGQQVTAGQTVLQLVPNQTYVVADFKETQVGEMHPGDHAVIEIDAYPGREFPGVVKSLSAATGSRFSLLPASNATGNFVKVVQRVPVHIDWATPPGVEMRAGMSVVASVDVHSRAR